MCDRRRARIPTHRDRGHSMTTKSELFAMLAAAAKNGGGCVTVLDSRKPPVCKECGIHLSDPPSKLCPGCKAYKEHQT